VDQVAGYGGFGEVHSFGKKLAWRNELVELGSEQLLLPISEHLLKSRVAHQNKPLSVLRDNRQRITLNQRQIPRCQGGIVLRLSSHRAPYPASQQGPTHHPKYPWSILE
jgi:hypothetical protein